MARLSPLSPEGGERVGCRGMQGGFEIGAAEFGIFWSLNFALSRPAWGIQSSKRMRCRQLKRPKQQQQNMILAV